MSTNPSWATHTPNSRRRRRRTLLHSTFLRPFTQHIPTPFYTAFLHSRSPFNRLLDLLNGLAWVEPLGTHSGAVHDGMTSIQFPLIIQKRKALCCGLVPTVNDPPVYGGGVLFVGDGIGGTRGCGWRGGTRGCGWGYEAHTLYTPQPTTHPAHPIHHHARTCMPATALQVPCTCHYSTSSWDSLYCSMHTGCTHTNHPTWNVPHDSAGFPHYHCVCVDMVCNKCDVCDRHNVYDTCVRRYTQRWSTALSSAATPHTLAVSCAANMA